MTEIKVGDKVRLTGADWPKDGLEIGTIFTIDEINILGTIWAGEAGTVGVGGRLYGVDNPYPYNHNDYACELVSFGTAQTLRHPDDTPEDPNHYKFPGGAEVRHISEWLTANAAQAFQYIARSSRIDGQNKGDAAEDLRKAIRFLEFELERLEVAGD